MFRKHYILCENIHQWNFLTTVYSLYLLDTFLWQDTHVDLQTKEGEHCQGEDGEDDDISEILDGVHDGTDYGF